MVDRKAEQIVQCKT